MSKAKKWKIEFGALDKEELLNLLSTNKVGMNAYAAQLFMDEKFVTSPSSRVAEIVEIRVEDLGFKVGALFQDIVVAADRRSLKLCPLELAPQFRVQYLNQEEGPYLTIASVKTRSNDDNYPNGFYLAHYSGIFWLRGYRSTADWLWTPDQNIAFVEGYA